jgi:hypothetical protein
MNYRKLPERNATLYTGITEYRADRVFAVTEYEYSQGALIWDLGRRNIWGGRNYWSSINGISISSTESGHWRLIYKQHKHTAPQELLEWLMAKILGAP